jgi:hypothetical protein
MKYENKQGDSFWLAISGDIAQVDPTWANWSGEWGIVAKIGDTPLVSGSLAKETAIGEFRFQLSLAASASLPLGNYYLILQISNVTADYRKEISQDKFIVTAQGLTP